MPGSRPPRKGLKGALRDIQPILDAPGYWKGVRLVPEIRNQWQADNRVSVFILSFAAMVLGAISLVAIVVCSFLAVRALAATGDNLLIAAAAIIAWLSGTAVARLVSLRIWWVARQFLLYAADRPGWPAGSDGRIRKPRPRA